MVSIVPYIVPTWQADSSLSVLYDLWRERLFWASSKPERSMCRSKVAVMADATRCCACWDEGVVSIIHDASMTVPWTDLCGNSRLVVYSR